MRVRVEDDGAGALTIGDSRFLLIRPETLAALQKAVETTVGRRAADCLAAGGRAGGARATASLPGTGEDRVTCGVLQSLATLTLGRPARVIEIQCAATGADLCRFEAHVE